MTKDVSKSEISNIDIIGASAGTGKTTRLANEFLKAVEGNDGRGGIDPANIIVCTFTNKAADELSARIRQGLLKLGRTDAAQLVLAGYIGTVNSICGRLLRDYALDCGLSPQQEVVPEEIAANLFTIASSSVIDAYAQRIEQVARRLSFHESNAKSKFQKRTHWMDHVRTICSLARANAIPPEKLHESGQRSWTGLKAYLGEPENRFDPDELDNLLISELDIVINKVDLSSDQSETTAKALEAIRQCFAHARTDGMTWKDWATIKKLNVSANSRAAVQNLLAAGAILHKHPRLHSDLAEYIAAIFDCAADSLEAYQNFKTARGLVDFVDQEYLALKLLNIPEVQNSLKTRIELVLIDEFQDTSPIQLSLFLKLAEFSARCIWVGDVKQAIYGFRGTDPILMQTAASKFNRLPPLEESFRSRPELVEFCNEVFKQVFPSYGISEDEVVIRPSGTRIASPTNSLELWKCEGEDLNGSFLSLAQALHELIFESDVRVQDQKSGQLRKVCGSDIAVLCRKNDHCSRLASALAQAGLKAAMIRDGLLETPECILTIATLRYLINPSDKLALGQIVHLTRDYNEYDQSAWLTQWLSSPKDPERLIKQLPDIVQARASLFSRTINDAINLALDAGGVIDYIFAWGNASERLSNLDALRKLVVEYETTCSIAGLPATIIGFLNYINHLEESKRPANTDKDAVQLLTYHGAKGLEWPIVVLADLDAEVAPKVHKDLCKIFVESSDDTFQISSPLQGRWIRFWPWPFGSVEKDGDFEEIAAASVEFMQASKRAKAENARLMYVGMTRARDMLIFAPYIRPKGHPEGIQWLDELKASDGSRLIQVSSSPDQPSFIVGGSKHNLKLRNFNHLQAASREVQFRASTATPSYGSSRASKYTSASPYSVRPSKLNEKRHSSSESLVQVIDIGERLQINGVAEMAALGECVHSFLAADNFMDRNEVDRIALANQTKLLWNISQIRSEALVEMSNRLRRFLDNELGKYAVHAECPITGRLGLQRLRGSIDLLVEGEEFFWIIDHKSFPGREKHWVSKALSFAPQLNAYKTAIEQSSEKPVTRLMIHMPIVGKIVILAS